MSIKEWLCGKKLKKEDSIVEILRKTGRIKELEKKYSRLERIIREIQTDINRIVARIINLERKRNERV